MKCPGCGVGLSKVESQEGCPVCDWDPRTEARLRERRQFVLMQKQEQRADNTAAEIRATIENDPVYGFADRLARWLVEQYRDEVPSWATRPIIWRNRLGSCHEYDPRTGKHQIKLSYHSITDSYDNGLHEYKTWTWLWHGQQGKGLRGVWQEVVHEFAHALQVQREGRRYGQSHTNEWAKAVQELQVLIPFEDAVKVARRAN